MSSEPNIDLSTHEPEQLLTHTVLQKLENGLVMLRLQGPESILSHYLDTAKIRVEIYPEEAFDELASKIKLADEHYRSLPIENYAVRQILDINLRVLESEFDAYTLYINIDPYEAGTVAHRYSIGIHQQVSATTTTKQGNPALKIYERVNKKWANSIDSYEYIENGFTKDGIGVQTATGIGIWRLYVLSGNGADYEYELEGVFRGRPLTRIASISADIDNDYV